MRTTRRVAALLALLVLLGLAPAAPAAAQAEPERYLDRIFAQVESDLDVVYGAAPDEDGVRQVLNVDVFTPVGDEDRARPAIVLAHGGGFVGGSKESMHGLAIAYAQRGFVAMSIEYRMHEAAGGISFPPDAAETVRILNAKHDMQAAVRWARAHASTYGIDPQRISVGGGSAGAVMAVLTATLWDDPGASGTPGLSSKVCTAISIMGAGEPTLVDATDAGAIFFHGDQDRTVPYAAAVATQEAMDAAGLPTEMVTFPGAGHSIPDPGLVEQRSSEWMVEHMVERPTGCAGPSTPAHASFVRAAHEDLLRRDATEDEVVREAGLLDAGGTRAALLARLTTSDEWLGTIVTGFYEDTLGREPDPGGLAYWVEALRTGRLTVAEVAASFYAAPEYYGRFGIPSNGTTARWVGDLYREILQRPASFDDIDYWVGEAVRRGRSWVALRMYQSPESRRQRVTDLYLQLLHRPPDPDGLAYWAGRIATVGDLALARSLAGSGEYLAQAVVRFP